MWRNWQTRMIQVHVGNHAGSSPVIRTKNNVVFYRKIEYGIFSLSKRRIQANNKVFRRTHNKDKSV